MDAVSGSAVAKGAMTAATGGSLAILGNMAGLTAQDWAIVFFCVLGSVFAGSYALQGDVEAKSGHDSEEAKRARKLAVTLFGAQFLLGMVAAAAVDGNVWKIIPACLVIGMSGPVGINTIKKFVSIGGGK